MELLGVMQAESDQSLKTCGNGEHQLIWIAGCDFPGRLALDDQLPKLSQKVLAAPANLFGNVVGWLAGAEHLIKQLKEF